MKKNEIAHIFLDAQTSSNYLENPEARAMWNNLLYEIAAWMKCTGEESNFESYYKKYRDTLNG